MQEVIQVALLGLGVGALYSLASQGLVLVYRGSGILNFAQGAIGMVGAFVWWDLQYRSGYSFAVAAAAGVLVAALIGALTHLLVMRPLRHAPPLTRLVATLGVLVILQSAAVLRYGTDTRIVPSELSTKNVDIFGLAVTQDRLVLVGIAVVLTAALWALYRYSRFGVATEAVAENQRASAGLGWSPDVIAVANWSLGGALTGVAAILITPIVQLQVTTMTTLTLAAMSAALVARFRSFPIALVAGVGIGVAQTLARRYIDTPGLGESLPFLVIVLVLIIRGQSLPVRGYFLERLPAVGSGRVRPLPLLISLVAAGLLIAIASVQWLDAIAITLGAALVLLSVVVITGYTGQLSLAQFAFAGIGAWVSGRLIAGAGWDFVPAAIAGIIATIPVGVLIALPAVRARGITLAVVTLGLGTTVELMIFNSPALTGGFSGTTVPPPDIFGFDIGSAEHPARYAIVCLVAFVIAALVVSNVRRGRTGRRMLAVRANEQAAAALGINVVTTKLYAFGFAAAIAAVGGELIAFKGQSIVYTSFTSFTSISYAGYAVIGGIGYLTGPLWGALLVPGALTTAITNDLLESVTKYLTLIGGGLLVLTVLSYQDGIAHGQVVQIQRLLARRKKKHPEKKESVSVSVLAPEREGEGREHDKVTPRSLEVSGLSVRYGGVVAVDGLDVSVEPGSIVGLIGPNGAGKTSAIDAITGFTRAQGQVELDGRALSRMSAHTRARAGVSRSFQSLQLFDDLTVLENLRAAADTRSLWAGLTDLGRPRTEPLSGAAAAAVREFGLEGVLDRKVDDLPYGQRRLVSLARAVATGPSVLLLDEPAAGLSERESAELSGLVRRLADEWGMAILLVEHDMHFVMSACDRIVVLDFGRTIADGVPSEIRNDEAVIAAYLGETEDEQAFDEAKGMKEIL